jgi:hypothetical protein
MSRPIATFSFIALAALFICCNQQSDREKMQALPIDSMTVETIAADSTTALELLLLNHTAEFKSSAMGTFVFSIDSIDNSSNHFWLYSVNDTMATSAADQRIVRSGDAVVWHFRKVGR